MQIDCWKTISPFESTNALELLVLSFARRGSMTTMHTKMIPHEQKNVDREPIIQIRISSHGNTQACKAISFKI